MICLMVKLEMLYQVVNSTQVYVKQ